MKHEYHEGPKAAENAATLMTRVFRAPKSAAKPVPKKRSTRKAKTLSKG
jgi:hypothetical protein